MLPGLFNVNTSITEPVLAYHLEMSSETDLEGLMSDYADDAVFISEDEVLEDHDGIRGYVRGFVAGIR